MCTLLVATRTVPGYPVILAHNRDELLARAWAPVQADASGWSPRDRAQGGTWLGLGRRGLLVAITNRMGEQSDEPVRSRGLLCAEALAAGTRAEALARVTGALERDHYHGFNLFLADAEGATALVQEQGKLRRIELLPGVHVITSVHHVDPAPLEPWRMEQEAVAAQGREALLAVWEAALRRHEVGPGGHVFCKHLGQYGTSSSSLISLDEEGRATWRMSHGPPCTHRYEPVELS